MSRELVLPGTAAVAIPLILWSVLPWVPALGALPEPYSGGSTFPPSPIAFERGRIGPGPDDAAPPRILNVQILDFDADGVEDLLACDGRTGQVLWYRQAPRGTWTEKVLGSELEVPCHATVTDIDRDGDPDLVVSILGDLFPNDEKVGAIALLLNDGAGRFEQRVILDGVRRVADVQAADLDNDGDVDLAAAVFGYAHGRVVWLRNLGDLQFEVRDLLHAPGTIHVPIADYDGDGDPDIATVASQDDETVWGFENLGAGRFRPRRLWSTFNFDIGSAGLVEADLDADGDADLVLPVGDNFENDHTYPQPYHGCLWLQNLGSWRFEARVIASFGGTYAADVGDVDGDGDLDVVLASMFNAWRKPGGACLVWLDNDGECGFTAYTIDTDPTHLVTVACGDLNGDGRSDVAAGGLHVIAPWNRMGRITAWTSR